MRCVSAMVRNALWRMALLLLFAAVLVLVSAAIALKRAVRVRPSSAFANQRVELVPMAIAAPVPPPLPPMPETSQMDPRCSASHAAARRNDAVVIILVPPPREREAAMRALRSLRNLNDSNRGEVRIFHDAADGYSRADERAMVDAVRPVGRPACTIEYQLARFPPHLNLSSASASPWRPYRFYPHRSAWGYMHMIRFFFSDLFERGTVPPHAKYWMRLDADACLRSPFNPWRALDERPTVHYLHNYEAHDCGLVAQGLAELAQVFAVDRGGRWHNRRPRVYRDRLSPLPLSPSDEGFGATEELYYRACDGQMRGWGREVVAWNESGCVATFFNNAEAGRIEIFREDECQKEWRRAVDVAGGVYRHRWGDAPLRRIGIDLCGTRTLPLPDDYLLSYRHDKAVCPLEDLSPTEAAAALKAEIEAETREMALHEQKHEKPPDPFASC